MIKNFRLFINNIDSKKYDLVTVRKYAGIQDGSRAWIFLSYAVVIPTEEDKAICVRDKDVEYTYARKGISEFCDYSKLNVGDIRIFSSSYHGFEDEWDESNIESFISTSGLYFDDDTKYGKRKEKKLIK